jgi:hypothetical protein
MWDRHSISKLNRVCVMTSANYSTYEFYVELLNTLLVLLSTQLHHPKLEEDNYFLDLLLHTFG